MAKRILGRITVALLSASFVVPMFNCFDVGAADTVSLQCREQAFTAIDLHPEFIETDGVIEATEALSPVFLQIGDQQVSDNIRTDKSQLIIEENTYTIDVSTEAEPIDVSLFTYDGSDVFVKVDNVNLREEPNTEAEIIDSFERGSCFVRISYGSDWSFVRSEEGTEGYILSSLITSDEEDPDALVEEPEEQTEETAGTVNETSETTETTVPSETTVEMTEETTAATVTETSVETTESTETAAPETTAAPQSYDETDCFKLVYATCVINLRTGPGVEYDMVRVLQTGEAIDVVAITSNGWYRTALGNYVKADLTSEQAPATPTPVPAAETSSESGEAAPSSGYSDFASYCMQYVGVQYSYGGSSPSGFDCSGYVSYVFANYYGISLPHDAASIATLGSPVSTDSMQCGDVLCHDYNSDGIIDHVSIYIGGGTYIHASNSRNGVITTTYAGSVVTVRRFI